MTDSKRTAGPLARDAMAYVLAGGRGSRLMELTDKRAKPAVFFGGKSRIIDFALSNALNSGIRRIGVATQYKAHSLIRHLSQGWNFLRQERNEGFDILPASQRVSESGWYSGTADAVYQNIDIIEAYEPKHIVILAGDHVYKMDYEPMLQQHVDTKADITIGCLEVPRMEATGFGVMHVDKSDKIVTFLEKPKDPPAIPGQPDMALASMGIYVFETKFLIEQLKRDAADAGSSHDFGKDMIPHIVTHGSAYAHRFSKSCVRSPSEGEAYWRDVGTVDSYWAGNLDLCATVPQLDLYDRNWPIWTYAEITPPAKFVHDEDGRRGMAVSSLVSGGCVVSGAAVRRSLLFTGVRVNSFASMEEAVVLPYADVGRNAILKKVVVDRGVVIPDGLVVGEDPILDAKRFRRSENGVCLITQDMINRMPDEPTKHPVPKMDDVASPPPTLPPRNKPMPEGGPSARAAEIDEAPWPIAASAEDPSIIVPGPEVAEVMIEPATARPQADMQAMTAEFTRSLSAFLSAVRAAKGLDTPVAAAPPPSESEAA
jgi:glucose-1-phosphate adenylyltransferase